MLGSPKIALLMLLAVPLVVSAADPVSGSAKSGDPEIGEILEKFAKRTGRKFIVDPRVRAVPGIVGIDVDKLTYEQLLATLAVNQFATVNQGDFTIVTVDAGARQLPTPVHTDTRFQAADDEWVTLLLKQKNVCSANLVPILRPLMPQAAHLAADPYSNSLVAVDRAVNARRLASLVEKIDAGAPNARGCEDWPPKKE
jgi:general secretion pathway protein D